MGYQYISEVMQPARRSTSQSLYRNVWPLGCRHYRNAVGALIVYDITKERSFRDVRNWVHSVRENADPSV